jgi:hypothetical protein
MGWADHFGRLPRLFSKMLIPKQVRAVCFDRDLYLRKTTDLQALEETGGK